MSSIVPDKISRLQEELLDPVLGIKNRGHRPNSDDNIAAAAQEEMLSLLPGSLYDLLPYL